MTELERLRDAIDAALCRFTWGDDCGSLFSPEGEEPHDAAGCLCGEPCRIWTAEYEAVLDAYVAAVRADERAKYLADSGGRNQTHATGAGYLDE